MENLLGQLKLDFRSNEPIYLQLVRQIEQLVAQGHLKTGTQLPTVRELATELRINFNTVARAYRLLDDIGLISTQRGRGTYIWEAPSAETAQRLRQATLEELASRYTAEAAAQGFSPAEMRAALEAELTELPQPEANKERES